VRLPPTLTGSSEVDGLGETLAGPPAGLGDEPTQAGGLVPRMPLDPGTGGGMPNTLADVATTGSSVSGLGPLPDVGDEVAGYRLMEVIGRGGFGVVFRGLGMAGERVAVKLLVDPTPRSAARFLREGEVVARFDHPHIVRLLQVGEHGGRPFHVLDFVDGRPLDDVAPLPPLDAARVMRDVARAVEYAHGHGILHRDVKPSNILVDPEGRACLLDFGVARDRDERARLTLTGDVVGTPHWMAPEQIRDAKRAGPAADVYGLGATLFYALTGETILPPDAGPLAVFSTEPPAPSSVSQRVPSALDLVCLKAVRLRPEERYPSAEAFAGALDEIVGDVAPPPSRALLPALAALAAVVVAGAGWVWAFGGSEAGSSAVDPSGSPAGGGSGSGGPTVTELPPDPALVRQVEAALEQAAAQAREQRSYQAPLMTLERARRLAHGHADLAGAVTVAKGGYLLRRGRYAEAARILAAEDLPARARFLSALAVEGQGDVEAARVALTALAKEAPASVEGLLARSLLHGDGATEAAGDARGALDLDPEDPYAHYALGRALRRGDPGAALEAFEAARRLLPDEPRVLSAWGTLALRRTPGQRTEALLALRRAVGLTEPNPDPALLEAWVTGQAPSLASAPASRLEAIEEHLAELDRLVALAPRSAPARFWRGALKLRRRVLVGGGSGGDHAVLEDPRAEEDWRQARSLDPSAFGSLVEQLPAELRSLAGAAVGD
jgi:hypothetical protein